MGLGGVIWYIDHSYEYEWIVSLGMIFVVGC